MLTTDWAKEDYEMMLAALFNYLNKQERHRDQALEKFGAEARTYGVGQRIAITARLIDQIEADYEARFGANLVRR